MSVAAILSFGAIVVVPGSAQPNAAGSCAHWVAAGGNDAGTGTKAAPYGTVAKLLSVLRPGQSGCFAPGTTIDEHIVINVSGAAGSPIRLMSTPNAQGAVLRGGIEFAPPTHDVVIQHVAIRAPATPTPGIVTLRGFRNAIVDSDLNGTETPDRSQACILLDHANKAVIDHNAIRECSKIVSNPTIYAAGIIDAVSVGAQITNNVIINQPADAIALAPNAQLTFVSRNLIQNNGSGVFFGGDAKAAANDNQVINNAIGPSTAYSVHASYAAGAPVGQRNVVSKNCFWHAAKGDVGIASAAQPGFRTLHNITGNPVTAKCAAYRPALGGAKLSTTPTNKPKPKPKPAGAKPLSSGLKLLAGASITGGRVTIVSPSVTGAVAGATVTLRCVKGCSLSETVKAAGPKVVSHGFANASLAVGDVVEVRATKSGFLGVYARFVVKPSVTTGAFQVESSGCLNGSKPVACPK